VPLSEIGQQIQINGTFYDGTPHWQHGAFLVLERDGVIITQTAPGTEVTTERGAWSSPYAARGHYWTERWFNVIRLDYAFGARNSQLLRPGTADQAQGPKHSRLRGFYCNIATPAEFDGVNLHYTDLQLDVFVDAQEDGSLRHRLLDEDEFEEAQRRFAYPESLVRNARQAVDEVVAMIEARVFPFAS
jgi:protein associated with RNAse G/E